MSAIDGFGDLAITADGANSVITIGNSTITLENIAPRAFSANDFIFQDEAGFPLA